ncbi:MAG: hypothetical protein ACRDC3_00890, partial [Paraclostridium dentum]
ILCIGVAVIVASFIGYNIINKIFISMAIYIAMLIITRCIRIKDLNWVIDSFRLAKDINVHSIKLYSDRYI